MNNTNGLKERLANLAIQMLRKNFGEYMVDLYRDLYLKLDKETILSSLRELLTEALGGENAKRQLQELEEEMQIKNNK